MPNYNKFPMHSTGAPRVDYRNQIIELFEKHHKALPKTKTNRKFNAIRGAAKELGLSTAHVTTVVGSIGRSV